MDVKYRIVSIDARENSAIVRFYTDTVTEDFLANSFTPEGEIERHPEGFPLRCRTDVNITIFDHMASEEEIHKRIQVHAPVDWFRLQEKILKGEGSVLLQAFRVGQENVFQPIEAPMLEPEARELTDTEIDDLLNSMTNRIKE